MTARARMLAVAALAPALVGCGGGGGGPDSTPDRTGASASQADTRRADPTSVRTIRGWVDAERGNRLDQAASYFSVPAIVLNGPEPLLLRTRTLVRAWHDTLPCGAALVRAVDVRGWTIARFRLTERPGGRCDATGHTATTAFAMREGKIALWIRVRDVAPEKAAPPRPPNREFLRSGRIGGRRVPGVPEQPSSAI